MKFLKYLVLLILLVTLLAVGFIYLAPDKATEVILDLRRGAARLDRKELTLPGGERYVYLEGGAGEPLLLLHGFGANKDNFTDVSFFLTGHYRVIAPDHIGFGESSRPPDAPYTPTAQVHRLRRLVTQLGLKKLHIGGSSMGGQIAMTYAALYPEQVESMWLLDPAGVWSAPESELRRIYRETGENPLIARDEDEFAAVFDFVMSKPPFVPRPILDVFARERIANVELEKRIFAEIAGDSIEDRIRGLKTPALIVWGTEDRAIHVDTAPILHGLLPNSDVIIMEGYGHLPMIEAPMRTANDYRRFRAGL